MMRMLDMRAGMPKACAAALSYPQAVCSAMRTASSVDGSSLGSGVFADSGAFGSVILGTVEARRHEQNLPKPWHGSVPTQQAKAQSADADQAKRPGAEVRATSVTQITPTTYPQLRNVTDAPR